MTPRSRRLGSVVAALIAALAVTIAALPLIQSGNGADALAGPAIIPRPIVTAVLLGLPAGIAMIGALRASRPMFLAAGSLCLLQSLVAFSGVTLGFVIPGIVLIALGGPRMQSGDSTRSGGGRARIAGLLVVGLGIAAWFALFATSETVCWIARSGSDGRPVYTRIAETNSFTLGANDLGAGCDGGAFTLLGLTVAAVFVVGALAAAALSKGRGRDPHATEA